MTEPKRASGRSVPASKAKTEKKAQLAETAGVVREIGGPKGLEPTRYGDWEKKGRCIDF